MIQISIKEELRRFLENYEKVAILGIGNELRGDDGLGHYIIENLNEKFKSHLGGSDYSGSFDYELPILIDAGAVPENFTGLIIKEKPSHLLIIDAVLINEEPGTIKIIQKEKIANISISTHSMSLSFLIKYLEMEYSFNMLFIGIQPFQMDLNKPLSKNIKKSSDELVDIIFSLL